MTTAPVAAKPRSALPALRESRGEDDLILMVNNDTEIPTDYVSTLVAASRCLDAAVGALIVDSRDATRVLDAGEYVVWSPYSFLSCSACHTRHQFAIEMARKPYTCSQCHKGPDVPAFSVYEVSKHGNLHSSLGQSWKYGPVPWKIGKDITAPTCATCHVSLLSAGGEIVAERTHQMNDRLPWRIFGPIYAHPHPKSADTSIIKNKAGLPLPSELTGEPASEFLISAEEQKERSDTMQKVCLSCHSRPWVEGHFERFQNTIQKTNEMTLAATNVLLSDWKKACLGIPQPCLMSC